MDHPGHPVLVDQLAGMIQEAKHPIILSGRGVLRSGAAASIEALAVLVVVEPPQACQNTSCPRACTESAGGAASCSLVRVAR